MSSQTKLISGIIILTVPTIQFGGYFLLSLLAGWNEMELTDFQRSMFRAGHAHAGVLVMLSLIAQIFFDHAKLPTHVEWFARIGFPTAAVLMSGGFFFSAMETGSTHPNGLINVLFAGAILLAISLIILGVGLIRNK